MRFTFELPSVELDTEHSHLQILFELPYGPCFFYLLSTALLFTRLKNVWPTLLPPAHKQGFAIQVRDLNLEAHDYNVDNEFGFAGTFSNDAVNRSHWLLPEAWHAERVRPCPIHSLCEIPFFVAETFPSYLRNSLKASVIFSFSGIFVTG